MKTQMKAPLFALALLGAPLAHAHGSVIEIISVGSSSPSIPVSGESESESEVASDLDYDKLSLASWALYNISDDALDLVDDLKDNVGIGATTAGIYLSDLSKDTKLLKNSALKLAGLYEDEASAEAIAKELANADKIFSRIRSAYPKVVTQLEIQGKISDGGKVKAAFVKVRSRYVYLSGLAK